jgi:hypothetical protein
MQTVKFKILNRNKSEHDIYDKAWVSTVVILLFSQMVDVQYFDGRISIILWILLSGLRNILEEEKFYSTREIK